MICYPLLPAENIDKLMEYAECADSAMELDVEKQTLTVTGCGKVETLDFEISPFDKALVLAGGWVDYADKRY
jgi:3-isopropylmalate/(R)-2-methylmalate dehydratase small subunit